MSTSSQKSTVTPLNKSGDSGGSDWPPRWHTLDHGIRVGRYVDAAFQQMEFDKLWPKVWQSAARIDEIPEINDYTVYEIGDQSVFLVRTGEDTVKAYHNVCPHRGTALAEGTGNFEHGNIICPFHGWRWNTEGDNEYVLIREEFNGGNLCDADVALKSLKVEIYAGFIFINFDDDCISFDEFIAPVRSLLDDLNTGEMRHYWWKAIPVASNWKVAQEAFFEGYHVPATHPQLETAAADFIYSEKIEGEFEGYNHHNIDYERFDNGHGRFFAGSKGSNYQGNVKRMTSGKDPVDAMADRLQLLVDGMDAQVLQADVDLLRSLKGKVAPEKLGAEYMRILYEDAAAKGRPMPKPEPHILSMWGGMIFIFPNLMVFPQAGNAMIYRTRPHPTDPDRSTFEIYSTRSLPADAPRERAEVEIVEDVDDPEQVYLIPRQDLGNLKRIQKGLHSRSIKQIWLAAENEKIILGMHQELDKYLQAED